MAYLMRFRQGRLGGGKGALIQNELSGTLATGNDQILFTDNARRLTPRECERLQGFPDDWTLIPYKGKPDEECPDTPRYRALGNSFAVPVIKWLGERINEVEQIHGV